MNGKHSNQNPEPQSHFRDPEPLAFISHYADLHPRGRRYNLSMTGSVLLHIAVLWVLLLFPELLVTRKFWGLPSADEPAPGDEKKYEIITYVPASKKPMYAPYRKPEGSLYSTQDALAISKPPRLVKDGNRMPYSRGTSQEPLITDIVTRFDPPAEPVKPEEKAAKDEPKDASKLPQGEPQGVDAKAVAALSPTAMIIPPKPKDSAAKPGDANSKIPLGDTQADKAREDQARQRLEEELAKQLKLADTGQKIFENEASALRSDGSGFFDTRGFELSGYSQYVVDRIKENWLIPNIIRSESGRTTILFYIEKDGQVSGIRVVTTSGNKRLDNAALNSVLVAGPFPPLPRDFSGEHIGAKLVFSYNEVRNP
jgi:periplasmic protein TonB